MKDYREKIDESSVFAIVYRKKAKVMVVLWDGLSKIIWFTQHRQRTLHGFRDN